MRSSRSDHGMHAGRTPFPGRGTGQGTPLIGVCHLSSPRHVPLLSPLVPLSLGWRKPLLSVDIFYSILMSHREFDDRPDDITEITDQVGCGQVGNGALECLFLV